ncbi:DUF4256 domain-containing protein [Sphingobacterium sp. LRF_L2]|uniref:DUF4256 domain-containing protein n=1 Tax=Sphingobacterium sp. LRF_L2 TaxID=3369421 RepID=UPI003F5F3660
MKKKLNKEQQNELLHILEERFEKYGSRHADLTWDEVERRLLSQVDKLWALEAMEATGGEPDVIAKDPVTGEYIFYDCAIESPKGRRSICYDRQALEARKANKPENSAVNMAEEMGIQILTEEEYRRLQQLGEFDLKTSSWVATPAGIRKRGGAIFCDRRYDQVFTYHNGADSYYAARGFRGLLRI